MAALFTFMQVCLVCVSKCGVKMHRERLMVVMCSIRVKYSCRADS